MFRIDSLSVVLGCCVTGRCRGCFVGTFLLLGAAGNLPRRIIHGADALLYSTVQFPVCGNQLSHLLNMLRYFLLEGGPDLLSVIVGHLQEGCVL